MADQTDAHEVKLLADILALVLAEEPGQADAALQALRRKARQSRISGGAVKELFLRLSRDQRPGATDHAEDTLDTAAARLLIAELRLTVRKQERELALERDNARTLEADLYETRRRFTEVQEENVRALASRRIWVGSAFAFGALGVAIMALLAPAVGHLHHSAQPASVQSAMAVPRAPSAPAAPELTAEQGAAISDFVHSCFLTSTNAIYAGHYTLNVLVQTDETGTIRSARISDQDAAHLDDPGFRQYAELVVRSLLEPRCASLPLPEAMLGRKRSFLIRFGA